MGSGLQGTLTGSLTEQDLVSRLAALQQEQQQALAQRTAQATQAAQQAQGAYLGAAGQPPPQLDPTTELLGTLLPGIASVLTQDKGAAMERGQQRLQQSRGELLKARQDNLTALRDVYSQRADEAAKAGDLEEQEKYRTKLVSLEKQFDLLDAQQRRTAGIEEAKIRAQAGVEEAKIRAQTAASERERRTLSPQNVPTIAEMVLTGQTKLTDFPIYEREQIVEHIRSTGQKILPEKARNTLETLKAARAVVKQIRGLALGPGGVNIGTKAGLGRFAAGAKKKAGAVLQSNAKAARLEATRKTFLATIARASGERGTLTDPDIARAEGLLPKLDTTEEVSRENLGVLDEFISDLEQGAISARTEKHPSQLPAATSSAPVQKWGRDANGNPIPLSQ